MSHRRWGFRASVFAGGIVLAVFFGGPAAAQTPAAVRSDPVHQNAVAFFDRGVKAAEKEDWKAAREAFLAAWKLEKAYQTAANLGWAELKLGDPLAAAEHLTCAFRQAPPKGMPPAQRDRLQAMLDQARAHIGTVTIRVDTPDAEVIVNGDPVGRTPLLDAVFVVPGQVAIEARKAGYLPSKTSRELTAGSSTIVELSLLPRSSPSVGPVATRTPLPARPDRSRNVFVGAGIGLTTAAVVAGTATAIVSADRAKKAENIRATRRCDAGCMDNFRSWQSAYNSMDRARVDLANASFWSFLGAGFVGAGTAVYALTTVRRNPPDQRGTNIRVGVYGTGLAVTGSW